MITNTELIARLRAPNGSLGNEAANAIEAVEIDRDTLKAEVNFLNAKLAKLNDTHNRLKKMVDDGSIQGRTYSAGLEQEKEIARLQAQLAAAQGQSLPILQVSAFVEGFLDEVEEPPEHNCRCCISPPCNDCIDHSGLRELFSDARRLVKTISELRAAPIQQQPAEPEECCEHCDDGDGLCVFPMYGPAPHTHDTSSGWIGSTRTLPKDQWGNNFREDPDCEGHGVYMRCEKCGRGEQPAAAAPQPKEPK